MVSLLAKQLFEEERAKEEKPDVFSPQAMDPQPIAREASSRKTPLEHPYRRETYQRQVQERNQGPWRTAPQSPRAFEFDRREPLIPRVDPSSKKLVTMTKTGLLGMIMGLLLLGGVFFFVGFLMGQNVAVPTSHPVTSSWATMSGSNTPQGQGAGGLTGLLRNTPGGHIIDRQITHGISEAGASVRAATTPKVPGVLQPFAQYYSDKAVRNTQNTLSSATQGRLPSTFATRSRAAASPPPEPQPMTQPQQMPPQQPLLNRLEGADNYAQQPVNAQYSQPIQPMPMRPQQPNMMIEPGTGGYYQQPPQQQMPAPSQQTYYGY